MSLDEGKLELVENICMMLEGVIDPADVRTELEHLEQGMVDNLEFKDSIKWLYTRYRGRCIGEEYDKIKWASEVYGSPEVSMRVARNEPWRLSTTGLRWPTFVETMMKWKNSRSYIVELGSIKVVAWNFISGLVS